MQPVILDTDVASLLYRRKLTGPSAMRLIGREPLITFVTFDELSRPAHPQDAVATRPELAAVRAIRSYSRIRDVRLPAVRWENARTGKAGWLPAVRGGWRNGTPHAERDYLPLTRRC
jgi:hypothetical protein